MFLHKMMGYVYDLTAEPENLKNTLALQNCTSRVYIIIFEFSSN